MPRVRTDKDYYRILGVETEAGEAEIKKAYRKLALQWHPDRNPGNTQASERFKEISEAYAVLTDPVKRGEYDQARKTGHSEAFAYTQEELFRDMFRNPGAAAIFEDIAREFERMGMRVDRTYFHQTLFGGRATVYGGVFVISPLTPVLGLFRLARAALRGFQPERSVGPGEKRGLLPALGRLTRWLLGAPPAAESGLQPQATDVVQALRLTRDEAERGVERRVTANSVAKPEQLLVRIPPGIQPGTRLRLRGKGRPGPDGLRGDLYLSVQVDAPAAGGKPAGGGEG